MEKYLSVKDFDMMKQEEQEKNTKKVISNDAYALVDLLSQLIQIMKR